MRWTRGRRRVVTVLGVVVSAVAAGAMGCADRLILHPTTGVVHAGGAVRRVVAREGGGEIEVWVARSEGAVRAGGGAGGPEVYVLLFSGNESRAERAVGEAAALWGEIPVEVWAVNYPGYGGSTGPARLAAMPGVGVEAFDSVRAAAGGRPVVVAGRSLGCTVALHVAATREEMVRGVVLQNPPALKAIILREFGWWNLWLLAGPVAWQVPGELDSPEVARGVRVRGVFVTAEADNVVVPKYQQRVIDAFAGEKRVVRLADAGHDSPVSSERDVGAVREGYRWVVGEGR